jgi:hypothetical protein
MKKVLITGLFVFAAVACSALPNFGAKIGGNFSKFTVSKNEMKYSFQPGFDLGFFARAKFNKWYVQPELVYSYQIIKGTSDSPLYANLTDTKTKTHNLNIPVLLGYKLVDVRMMNIRAFIGPEFNYILNENTDLRSPTNIMGCIGAGVDIAMLTLDLKYGYTFTKAFKDEDTLKLNPHNNVISIHLGWKFL